MRRRTVNGGFALVEVVVAGSILIVLMGLCALVIHALLQAEKSGRSLLAEEATLARLGREFRRDVHEALAVDPQPDGDASVGPVTLREPEGRQVSYRVEDDALVVTRSKGDADDEPRSRTYRLPRRGTPRLAVVPGPGSRAMVRLEFADDPEKPSFHDARIEAVVGRDHRFEPGGETP